ncbi:MAG: GNAT family protein [Clostridium sp.]|uniref:GNAT family N-acetyltransferase n=1 Tax=Clostridium sp. TaxID=1506 RepID=UPI002FCA750C
MVNHLGTKSIETNRLLLRKFNYEDTTTMLKNWISDPLIQSLYCEPVYSTQDEVKSLIDKYINSYSQDDFYRWAIILKDTKECIGQIAFYLVNTKYHFAEIEYCIGSKFQNKGFATEATKSLINFGFNQINLHKIQICHKSINIPSKKVIEKCGFTYEGTLRDYFYENGQYIDRLYYSILKSEF